MKTDGGAKEGASAMRFLGGLAILAVVFWIVDALWFNGINGAIVWQEMNYQGQKFRSEIDMIVKKVVNH